jgi:hypothetical protein
MLSPLTNPAITKKTNMKIQIYPYDNDLKFLTPRLNV